METRIGNQRPTNCFVPEYTDTRAAEKSLKFLDAIGFTLDPWQQWVLTQMLGKRDDGTFAAKEALLLVSRQCGKTRCLEARALAGLFILGEELIVHTAQVFPTAKESYLRVKGAIENCPALAELIDSGEIRFTSGNDNLSVEYRPEGQPLRRVLYKARGENPIRGFSPQVIIADEAYAMTDEIAAALENALAAQPHGQYICTSSTGLDHSDYLLRMRDRGLQEEGKHTLALMEWCADPGCDLDDIEQWYQAIPALGIRITLDSVAAARRSQPDKQFGRERLGLWADNKFRAVIDLERWTKELCKPESQITSKYVLSVDATPSHPHDAAVSIAGFTPDGKKQVEVLRTGRSLNWVVDEVKSLYGAVRNPPPLAVVVQAGAKASSLVPELQKIQDRDGNFAEIIELGARDVTNACGYFVDCVDEGSIVHLGDQSLATALSGATKINVGKLDGPKGEEEYRAFYWGRKDILIDISPLCSSTYALWGLNLKKTEAELTKPHYDGKPRGGGLW